MTTEINYETKVLVLDYFASIRFILSNLLKEIGFKHIYKAGNVAQALSVIQKEDIGLFIADWDLPKILRSELLQGIRKQAAEHEMLVLVATAEGFRADIIEALETGADDCLFKPFTVGCLKDKIERNFRKRQQQDFTSIGSN